MPAIVYILFRHYDVVGVFTSQQLAEARLNALLDGKPDWFSEYSIVDEPLIAE